jgi:hypothetical protein
VQSVLSDGIKIEIDAVAKLKIYPAIFKKQNDV